MCIPKSNHKNLVDTCYPAPKALANIGPEYRPNSNELSRLAYYAANKPAKLLKVGQYIDTAKVQPAAKAVGGTGASKDAAKGSLMVSLAITKTLIVECKQTLNYLLPSVTSILQTALTASAQSAPGGKRDVELATRCASVFYALCTMTDPSLASLDTGSRSAFAGMLGAFASMAQARGPGDGALDGEDTQRIKLVGLGALSGLVSGDLLYTATFRAHVRAALPALLHNVLPLGAGVDVAFLRDEAAKAAEGQLTYTRFKIKRQPLASRRAASIDVDAARAHAAGEKGPSAQDCASAAIGVLQALLAHGDASQVATVVSETVEYLEAPANAALWAQTQWCAWLTLAYATFTPVQCRFVVVSQLADRLVEISDSTAPAAQQEQQTLLSMIGAVLSSPTLSLIGLSTSELVNNLLGLAVRRVHALADPEQLDEDRLLPALVDVVGSLGQHVYYAEQLVDIADEITARIELLQMPDEESQRLAQQSAPGAQKKMLGGAQGGAGGAEKVSVAVSTAHQKDESIRVLLYCLIATLRQAHAAASQQKQDAAKAKANGHAGHGAAAPKSAAKAKNAIASSRAHIPLAALQGVAGLLSWPSAVARLPFEQTLQLFLQHEVATAGSSGAFGLVAAAQGSKQPPSTGAQYLTTDVASTHESCDASIGTLHALAASAYVTALSRALFVPDALRRHPLEALVLIERANGDLARPIKPDAIASANPIDYAAIDALLCEAVHKLPVPAALALVPMLAKLERDAPNRIGERALGNAFGDLEAQRLIATRRTVAKVYAALAREFSLTSIAGAANKVLASLPKSDVFLPEAPLRLAPPDNVYQFRNGPPPTGFDSSRLFPVLEAGSVATALASSEALQRATGLPAATLLGWLQRDWSVSIAVDDSFIAASPFRDDLPPEHNGLLLSAGGGSGGGATPARRASSATGGGASMRSGGGASAAAASGGLLPNTYGRGASISGDASLVSLNARTGAQEKELGVQDLRDALQPKTTYSGGVGTALSNGSAYQIGDTSQASNNSAAARRASRRTSRRALGNAGGDGSLLPAEPLPEGAAATYGSPGSGIGTNRSAVEPPYAA